MLQTAAWKSLPVDQKKRMLEYIRDKRVRKAAAKAKTPAVPATESSTAAAATAFAPAPVATNTSAHNGSSVTSSVPTPAVKTDPYLQMLQRRSITTTPSSSAGTGPLFSETLDAPHPNSAYIAPAQVAQYTDRKTRTARWKVVDSEFYDEKCGACDVVHKEFDGAKGGLLNTMGAMMNTFGDYGRPCALAVQQVKDLGT